MKKVLVTCVCLLVVGTYFFGYRLHTEAHTDTSDESVITKPPKADKAVTEQEKLVAAWRQIMADNAPDGDYDIAVFDSATGATTHFSNANTTYDSASAIKLSILEDTLWQDQQHGIKSLTSNQLNDAIPMIEQSDNDAATDLWTNIGGQRALQAFFQKIGAAQSTANVHWGLTQTTALDQLKVINQVAYASKVLTPASANQANQLMDQIDSGQRWGIGAGVSAGVAVELKDGWLDDANGSGTEGWDVNSIGHVHGDGMDYTIAVLTDNDNTEQDGINTIQSLAAVTWNMVSLVDNS